MKRSNKKYNYCGFCCNSTLANDKPLFIGKKYYCAAFDEVASFNGGYVNNCPYFQERRCETCTKLKSCTKIERDRTWTFCSEYEGPAKIVFKTLKKGN